MNFNIVLEEFRRFMKVNQYSKSTISSYCEAVKNTLSDMDLDILSQDDLDKICFDLVSRYESNGNRIRFGAINLFCKVILKRDKKELYLKIPKPQIKNKDILTNKQVEEILNITKTKKKVIYALFRTIYDCALRKKEACDLNVEDVNFETMELSLKNTKTGDQIVTMTTRVAEAIKDYILYERNPRDKNEKALFLNKYGTRIGEHFVRGHLKECAVEAGIKSRVYPHLLRASCITHLLNEGANPYTVQVHARHRDFKTTMIYNRPTQQQMKLDIERILVRKPEINDEDRQKVVIDKYLRGELTQNQFVSVLDSLQPKQLKQETEFTGYE